MPNTKNGNHMTRAGLINLGVLLKRSREALGMGQERFAEYVLDQTGHKIGSTTVSALERGTRELTWNTAAAIAATGALQKKDGSPYQDWELFYIACEKLDIE